MKNLDKELKALVGGTHAVHGWNRRSFIQATVGAGFAAAVLPVSAQTIHTDSDGLQAGYLTIEQNGVSVPIYAARPAGKKNLPIVLVVSEVFGLHEHIADIARRFAKAGYLAVAPDLFKRVGDPTTYTSIPDLMKDIVSKVGDEQVFGDLDACLAWAGANGGNAKKAAIAGFCWGGRIVWLYAERNPSMKAGIAWYGRLTGDATPLQPTQPIDLATQLKVPVLGLYGAKDQGISVASVQQMKAALAPGHSGSEFVVYSDAGHAFNADYRSSYVPADAKDGWQRTLTWLHQHGVR